MDHVTEILEARKWIRELLLRILEERSYDPSKRSAFHNLQSQQILRAAFNCIFSLSAVAYDDEKPRNTLAAELMVNNWSDIYNAFQCAAEQKFDFIEARGILIKAVKQMNVEQRYDQERLWRLPQDAIMDDEVYSLQPGPMVSWLREDLRK